MIHLEDELNRLRESLVEMGFLVIGQLSRNIEALASNNKDLAQEVIRQEKRVNALELGIDKECEMIFTLQAPVAKDMRLVFATLKINANLERIGDYADGISKIIADLEAPFDANLLEELQVQLMGNTVVSMLTDVIMAYNEDNTAVARGVFTADITVNKINKGAVAIIAENCRKDLGKIEQNLQLLSIIRKIERVGDHITNIAEEIVFSLEATVLKHKHRKSRKNNP